MTEILAYQSQIWMARNASERFFAIVHGIENRHLQSKPQELFNQRGPDVAATADHKNLVRIRLRLLRYAIALADVLRPENCRTHARKQLQDTCNYKRHHQSARRHGGWCGE